MTTPPDTAPIERRSLVADLLSDLRFGVRHLRRAPGFVLGAAGTLALGLGGAIALFSLVKAVLLDPLANEGGDRLYVLAQDLGPDRAGLGFSVPELDEYRRELSSVEAVVEHHAMTFNLLGQGEPREVRTGVVDDRFFASMGLRPLMGRFFTAEENAAVTNAVLVLSYGFWQEQLGGDPGVIGRVFTMNGMSHTVIGVLPPITQFPLGSEIYVPTSQCPVRSDARFKTIRAARMMTAVARVRAGVTAEALESELALAAGRIGREHPSIYPEGAAYRLSATPLKTAVVGDATRPLLLLLGATVLVLVVAVSNVAGLQLARLAGRDQELALRMSLGAGRGRLARQLIVESTLLALIGGSGGLVLAWWLLDPLRTFATQLTPRAGEAAIDAGVVAVALALAVGTGILVGLVATVSARARGAAVLRAGAGASMDRGKQRMLAAGVVIQLSFAFVMLVGAGLLLRSLAKVRDIDPGFDVDHVVSMRVVFPVRGGYDRPRAQHAFWTTVLEGLRARPGVVAAGVGSHLPLAARNGMAMGFEMPGRMTTETERPLADVRIVTTDYFRALGIPVRRGRAFEERDRAEAEEVVAINESFARRYFGGADPVGQTLVPCDMQARCDGADAVRIVAVVGDVSETRLDVPPGPAVYGPAEQSGMVGQNLVIRTEGDPAAIVRTATDLIRAADRDLPIEDVRTMATVRSTSLAPRRLVATLLGLFALLAALVAGAGVAALTAFMVSQREREIGIRMALGADATNVVALMTGFAGRALLASMVFGAAGAYLGSRVLAGMLWRVGGSDVPTYFGAALLLAAGVAASAWATARRAGRMDPVTLIRAG